MKRKVAAGVFFAIALIAFVIVAEAPIGPFWVVGLTFLGFLAALLSFAFYRLSIAHYIRVEFTCQSEAHFIVGPYADQTEMDAAEKKIDVAANEGRFSRTSIFLKPFKTRKAVPSTITVDDLIRRIPSLEREWTRK